MACRWLEMGYASPHPTPIATPLSAPCVSCPVVSDIAVSLCHLLSTHKTGWPRLLTLQAEQHAPHSHERQMQFGAARPTRTTHTMSIFLLPIA
eukprot:2672569-Prymnesium_polylepis.1